MPHLHCLLAEGPFQISLAVQKQQVILVDAQQHLDSCTLPLGLAADTGHGCAGQCSAMGSRVLAGSLRYYRWSD
jgi:hypothetical protein